VPAHDAAEVLVVEEAGRDRLVLLHAVDEEALERLVGDANGHRLIGAEAAGA
jgi:hypothetical protein